MHKRNVYTNGINDTFIPVTLGHNTFIVNPTDLSMCYIFAAIYHSVRIKEIKTSNCTSCNFFALVKMTILTYKYLNDIFV